MKQKPNHTYTLTPEQVERAREILRRPIENHYHEDDVLDCLADCRKLLWEVVDLK
jgi:hypothetical protein